MLKLTAGRQADKKLEHGYFFESELTNYFLRVNYDIETRGVRRLRVVHHVQFHSRQARFDPRQHDTVRVVGGLPEVAHSVPGCDEQAAEEEKSTT